MVCAIQEPGKALLGKLCAHVRPKCHPLLLDTSINSPATVRLNLFQIMLLAAMKLHCQVRLPDWHHNATTSPPYITPVSAYLQGDGSSSLTQQQAHRLT